MFQKYRSDITVSVRALRFVYVTCCSLLTQNLSCMHTSVSILSSSAWRVSEPHRSFQRLRNWTQHFFIQAAAYRPCWPVRWWRCPGWKASCWWPSSLWSAHPETDSSPSARCQPSPPGTESLYAHKQIKNSIIYKFQAQQKINLYNNIRFPFWCFLNCWQSSS